MNEKKNTLLYVVIYRQLLEDIQSGVYQNGDLLPPEQELMDRFNASRTTIRHAISLLSDGKLVTVRQGRGTVVTYEEETRFTSVSKSEKFKSISSISSQTRHDGELKTQNGIVDLIPAPAEVAEKLPVKTGEDVYRIRRLKLIDNQPFGYVVSYLPAAAVPGFEVHSGKITKLYTTLKDAYNITITGAREIITSCSCEATESLLLNIPLNAPLLMLTRIGYIDEKTLEYTKSYYNPDSMILEYTKSFYDPEKFEIIVTMEGFTNQPGDDYLDQDSN